MTLSTAAKRERKHVKFKGAVVSAVASNAVNLFNQEERSALKAECAYAAVHAEFGWLSMEQLLQPPTKMFDAKLARQIAIHIMVNHLALEQRHISRMQGRQRTSIHFALQAVERRLEDDRFAVSYDRMASRAMADYLRHSEGLRD